MKRGKRFTVPFCIIMLVVLVLIIAVLETVRPPLQRPTGRRCCSSS